VAVYRTVWVHGFFFDGQNQLLPEIYLPPRIDVDANLANGFANDAATHWDVALTDSDNQNNRFAEPRRIPGRHNIHSAESTLVNMFSLGSAHLPNLVDPPCQQTEHRIAEFILSFHTRYTHIMACRRKPEQSHFAQLRKMSYIARALKNLDSDPIMPASPPGRCSTR
jgi:hypothetical protein